MMNVTLKTTTLVAVSALLGACGGTETGTAKIAGKEGTASAVHALSAPTEASAKRADTKSDVSDHSHICRHGGTAKLHGFSYSIEMLEPSVVVNFTMTLDRCGLASSRRGDALYTGDLTVSQKVFGFGGRVSQRYHGTVVVGGAFDDTLEIDVTEAEGVSDLTRTGTLSVSLSGTARTSRASHTFAGDHTVDADSIAVEDSE
jgi:hypothetical protein